QTRDLQRELLEDRLQRLSRPAPGSPKSDEQRPACDRFVESRLLELTHVAAAYPATLAARWGGSPVWCSWSRPSAPSSHPLRLVMAARAEMRRAPGARTAR